MTLENFKRIVIAKINVIDAIEAVNGRVELIEQVILLQVKVCIQKMFTLVLRNIICVQQSLADGSIEEVLLPLVADVGGAGGEGDWLTSSNFVL